MFVIIGLSSPLKEAVKIHQQVPHLKTDDPYPESFIWDHTMNVDGATILNMLVSAFLSKGLTITDYLATYYNNAQPFPNNTCTIANRDGKTWLICST